MRTMRLILADRLSGGAIAVATAVMLLLQAVAGSLACSMTIMVDDASASVVLCSPSESPTAGHAHPDDPSGPGRTQGSHDCSCALFCQFAGAASAMLPADGPNGMVFARAAVVLSPFANDRLADPRNNGLISEARAPPALRV